MKNLGTKRLIAYRLTEPAPEIRPGVVRRQWMDDSPHRFAYRCLPLTIANSFGWELLSPVTFEATWNGGVRAEDVSVTILDGVDDAVISHFGVGVLTFHTGYLFRTEATISLMAMGPPNAPKDGIAPLVGVIETSWAPYPFTMNWRFTRPDTTIRFERGEPFCFIVPVSIGMLEGTRPELSTLAADPRTKAKYDEWVASRASFIQDLKVDGSEAREEKWQKKYHRGLEPGGTATPYDHRSALTVREFGSAGGAGPAKPRK